MPLVIYALFRYNKLSSNKNFSDSPVDEIVNDKQNIMIIFLWTPPHFWALSLYRSEDYQKAGIPMLPVVKGKKITRLNIILYSLSLLIISPSLWYLGFLGNIYGISKEHPYVFMI